MPNSTPRRSAHALPNRDRAPQARARKREYLSDARCRELYQQQLGGRATTAAEHSAFLRAHREFIADVFDLSVDLDAKYGPDVEGDEL
jgi:hypothetical protein